MNRLSLALCLLGLLVCLAVADDQTAGGDDLVVEAIGINGPVLDFLSFNSTNIDDQRLKRAYSLSVNPSSGEPGASFTVTYTADSVRSTWIGVFASRRTSTSLYKYVRSRSGSVTFSTSGLGEGTYDVYLVISTGSVRARATYTVTASGGGSTPVPSPAASPEASPEPSSGASPVPSPSSPAPSASASPKASQAPSSGDAATWLNEHNAKRARYGVPALAWSTNLESSAQSYANTLAAGCTFSHSGGNYGENLAMGHSSIAAVLNGWVDSEAQYYDPVTKRCSGGTCGHFTQVLWRMTAYVGCGIGRCSSGRPIYVCQYLRPGNCNGYDYQTTSSPCGPLGP